MNNIIFISHSNDIVSIHDVDYQGDGPPEQWFENHEDLWNSKSKPEDQPTFTSSNISMTVKFKSDFEIGLAILNEMVT